MHIHGAQLHGNLMSQAGRVSEATAKRAEDTRKKLFDSAAELEAMGGEESTWMVQAWAGSDAHAQQSSQMNQSAQGQVGQGSGETEHEEESAVNPTIGPVAGSGKVSFWA